MSPRALGTAILALALPLAALGMLTSPNAYRAMGVPGVDCDGPAHVFLFAVPAFAIYAAAAVLNGVDYRRPRSALIAVAALLLCVGLGTNLVRAWQEARVSAADAACR